MKKVISEQARLQQAFLRDTAAKLKLSQPALAKRLKAPWTTLQKWLLPAESENAREMPDIAWQLCKEILANQRLKKKLAMLTEKSKG